MSYWIVVPLVGSVLVAVALLVWRLRSQVTLLSVVRPVPARDQRRASSAEDVLEVIHAADAISFPAPLAEALRHPARAAPGDEIERATERVELEQKLWSTCCAEGAREGVHVAKAND